MEEKYKNKWEKIKNEGKIRKHIQKPMKKP